MRVMAGNRPARSVSGRLNRNCEFLFGTRRPPARLGRPSVTIRFNGKGRLLPRLVGPKRARLAPPSFRP
jgi:hypothetical protein